MENGFQGKEGQQVPEMTKEIIESISNRYIELYEQVTGDKFERTSSDKVLERVEDNIKDYLQKNS